MTLIDIAETELQAVDLASEQRVTLGGSAAVEDTRIDRVSLGKPVCMPLDMSVLDEQDRQFLFGRPGSRFWLLALTCSFREVADAPIESAYVEVQLAVTAPEGADEPTAWSMEPLKLSNTVKLSRTVKLDASLKLSSDVVPIEVGPSAGVGTTQSYERSVPYLQAHREGTQRPVWFFTRTPAASIGGVHRMRTVVELPAGAAGRAAVGMGATLRLKRFGLIPYRAILADLPDHRFVEFAAR